MEFFFDSYVAPNLVATIFLTNLLKSSSNQVDILYKITALGTILSALYSLVNFHSHRYLKSRKNLTLSIATSITLVFLVSLVSFNCIRIDKELNYTLPKQITETNNPPQQRQPLSQNFSTLFKYHFYADLIPALLLTLASQLCSLLKHDLLYQAKRKFSFGEASIVAQLVTAAYLTWSFTLYSEWTSNNMFVVETSTAILLNIGATIFFVLFLPKYLLNIKSTVIHYGLLGLTVSVSYHRAKQLILQEESGSSLDPISWLINYIFVVQERFNLFSLWLLFLTACLCFSTSWTNIVGKTNTVMRKLFHFAVVAVFITGYLKDIEFTKFAAGCLIVIMFILEYIRANRLQPFGARLETICAALRGKWDNRYLTLSHIYLLVGIFLPFWLLSKNRASNKLSLSCGVIAVGVGDSMAAIIGTFFGKTRILRTNKTFEGLLGNMLSMLIFKLIWIGYSNILDEFSFLIITFFTAAFEALIDNCDNLTLPLTMNLLLEIF